MTKVEIKAYIDYVFSNDITPEENRQYWEYMGELEAEFGCDASVVPIEVIRQGREATDAYYEKFVEERERQLRNQS